ncbi:DUF4138 domain-containing protein [Pontibacter beigongshangensis]|uniref:DUF4138 domain-containing protein n=1 Tax=Pontibacter beigongshangensis TaxID=2574733 RepID=UPI0016509903|nr:DUF4138 domain-containing protein [Pontibacter beigongshangensis]
MSQKVKFINTNQSTFFATTQRRVEAYLKEKGISKNANRSMWAKATFFVAGFFSLYLLILSSWFGTWAMLGMTVALGAFAAFIGFNICHDAIHGSFSRKVGINKGLGYLFYLIGTNPYLWNISHNIVHHTYTNIPGHDEDIEVAPGLIRLDENEAVNKIQRYQHLYAFCLYGLASLSWVLRKDYVKFFQERIGQHRTQHPKREYFNLFFYKILHYFLFIGIPVLVLSNKSPVPYDIDFVRFSLRDRKQVKRTATQEEERIPLYAYGYEEKTVEAGGTKVLVFALEKAPITKGRELVVELFEKNGGRHLQLKVRGKDILQACPLLL